MRVVTGRTAGRTGIDSACSTRQAVGRGEPDREAGVAGLVWR